MRTMTVSQFKAHALGVLKGVAETNENVVITKHGKPLAIVGPYQEPGQGPEPGRLAGTISFEGDIVSPLTGGRDQTTRRNAERKA